MVHDVIMVSGYYLVSRREFNLTSIAVLLTITGYSINDTIVIYDRIREEMARYKGKPLPEIINIAVNDTLSRTILTSGVTALSLVGLLIFGVGEIWDFAMAMLIGIIVGTYSQRVHRQPAHHLARPACGEEEGRWRSDEGPRGVKQADPVAESCPARRPSPRPDGQVGSTCLGVFECVGPSGLSPAVAGCPRRADDVI